jgi:NAD(P)-dependent dehydrogenase (short-subunit alcohol dehydrogenase family)
MAEGNLSLEEFNRIHSDELCLKRIGIPQEIANLVVFLASDLCPFITGANLVADGGYTTI